MARTRSLSSTSGLVFLDTHVVAWLYAGEDGLLTPRQRRAIETHSVCISPFARLELDFLHEIGRIRVGGNAIVAALQGQLGAIVKNDPADEIVSVAARLSWTRDPFDRLIAAHALLCKGLLATADQTMRRELACCI